MNLAYRFRLYPTKQQEQSFLQTAGCCRWIWNNLLEQNIKLYESEKKFIFKNEAEKQLPVLKREHVWLKTPNSQSIQQVCMQFDTALRSSFKSNSNRKGFPKFKSKKGSRCSFSVPQYFEVNDRTIKLPKIGLVKFKKHRKIVGEIKSLVISRDVDQWFVSVLAQIPDVDKIHEINRTVGIDLGLKTFAVMSDGSRFELPRKQIETLEKHLKIQQKKLARKAKGSNNREKQRIVVAKKYRKIRRIRENFLHQTSSAITKRNDLIAAEDLNISGMMKNHKLARSIGEQGWYSFKQMLKYKCQMQGKHFVEIDRFYPSTKTCSNCGFVQDVKLSERTFHCHNCGFDIDRDYNASLNINRAGIVQIKACGDHVSLNQNIDGAGSMKQEALIASGIW